MNLHITNIVVYILSVDTAIMPIASIIGDIIFGYMGIVPTQPVNAPPLRMATEPAPYSQTCRVVAAEIAADYI